jgi:hypothetical protein
MQQTDLFLTCRPDALVEDIDKFFNDDANAVPERQQGERYSDGIEKGMLSPSDDDINALCNIIKKVKGGRKSAKQRRKEIRAGLLMAAAKATGRKVNRCSDEVLQSLIDATEPAALAEI